MGATPNATEFLRAFARECRGFPRFGANRATRGGLRRPMGGARQNLPVPIGVDERDVTSRRARGRRFAVCEGARQVDRMWRTAWWARISLAW